MKRILVTAALIASAGLTTTAGAADLEEYASGPVVERTPVEFGSGWYLRGDIGFNLNGHMKEGGYANGTDEQRFTMDDVMTFGVGVGYHVNDMFRIEGTFETLFDGSSDNTHSIASTNCPVVISTDSGPIDDFADNCLGSDSGEYHANVAMLNGYFDLGSFGNFQPYVGGGIGIARVRWWDETGSITCVPVHADVATETCVAKGTTDQPVPNEPVSFQGTKATGIDYQFAYSAMAGFGYRLTDNITLDANYRFLSTGADAINYSNGSHIGDGGFGVHQVRAGLRWELW